MTIPIDATAGAALLILTAISAGATHLVTRLFTASVTGFSDSRSIIQRSIDSWLKRQSLPNLKAGIRRFLRRRYIVDGCTRKNAAVSSNVITVAIDDFYDEPNVNSSHKMIVAAIDSQ